jgi:ubiquinone/menaquinone biosynthesis C-methylase UbiE
MRRVLDLGCGRGDFPVRANLLPDDEVVGVDIDEGRLAIARQRFPERKFHCANGESLPFSNASFDRVVSSVALPYMDIPQTLAEVRRILTDRGTIFFSVHPLRFTMRELWASTPRPVAMTYRIFVLLNGVYFHLTGKVLRVAGRGESFQTKRGLRIALGRAGFSNITLARPEGRLLVEARCTADAAESNPGNSHRDRSSTNPRLSEASHLDQSSPTSTCID